VLSSYLIVSSRRSRAAGFQPFSSSAFQHLSSAFQHLSSAFQHLSSAFQHFSFSAFLSFPHTLPHPHTLFPCPQRFPTISYRGLGSGIPRAVEACPTLELIDDRRGNQFKVVIRRLNFKESQPESQPESRPESQPESLVSRVLLLLATKPATKAEISSQLGQKEVSGQLNKVIRDLLMSKRIEYTIPDKPNSRLQQYRIRRVNGKL